MQRKLFLLRDLALVSLVCAGCGTADAPQSTAPATTTSANGTAKTPVTSEASSATNETSADAVATSPLATDVSEKPAAKSTKKTSVPTQVAEQEPAREPATAAEILKIVDLTKLPKLNEKNQFDSKATYMYYAAKANVSSSAAFYRAELESAGWKEIPTSIPSTSQYVDQLYEKGGFFLRLSIGSSGDDQDVGIGLSSLGNFDMRTLPVPPDTEPVEGSSPVNANYRTGQSIADVAKFAREQLGKLGWQEYAENSAELPEVPHYRSVKLRKNAVRLNVSIARNPQNPSDKIVMAYMAESALPFDVPVIAGAKKVMIDWYSGRAEYETKSEIADCVQFLQTAGKQLGWRERPDGVHLTDESASLLIEDQPEFGFGIQVARKDETTHVKFQRLTYKETQPTDEPEVSDPLVAENEPERSPTDDVAEQVEDKADEIAEKIQSELGAEFDKLGAELKKLGVDTIPGLGLRAKKSGDDQPKKTATKATPNQKPLAKNNTTTKSATKKNNVPQGTSMATVKLGTEEFKLTHVVAFEKKQFDEVLPAVLFSDKPINIQKLSKLLASGQDFFMFDVLDSGFPNALELRLDKDYVSLNCNVGGASISTSGTKVKKEMEVTGDRITGKAFLEEPDEFFDKPFDFTATFDVELLKLADRPASSTGDDELVLSENHELPLPDGCESVSQQGTAYRKSLTAQINVPMEKVLQFYKTALPSDQWKPDAKRTKETKDVANLGFSGSAGPISVTLKPEGDGVQIEVTSVNDQQAKKDGIAPQPGKAKLVLGNASDAEVVVVVGKKEHKLAAGVGANDPSSAVKIDIEPGKQSVQIKQQGKVIAKEDMAIEAGSSWGFIVLPAGQHFADRLY